jgi:ubiquinone/menaquinone biosynthesis C-methylase UbiE
MKEHPEIDFVHGDFMKVDAQSVDLIIFSDVVEHVEDDKKFMEKCARCGKYGLFKIPIEDSLYIKLQIATGRRFPPGPNHPSGHVHDYTYNEAIALVEKYFSILSVEYPDYTEVVPRDTFFGKIHSFMFIATRKISSRLCSALFGGPIFVLGKSKLID